MNNPLEGLAGLPDEQKRRLEDAIEQMQVRDRCLHNTALDRLTACWAPELKSSGICSATLLTRMFTFRSLRMYNSLVEKCFKDCVESFRRKDLEGTEEKVSVPPSPHALTLSSFAILCWAGKNLLRNFCCAGPLSSRDWSTSARLLGPPRTTDSVQTIRSACSDVVRSS